MQGYFAVATLFLLVAMVLTRVFMLNKMGIKAMRFGEMDKSDFLIPPFAFLFFYIVLAGAFNWPQFGTELFKSELVSWLGVLLCALSLLMFLFALYSFGKSFRVGVDEAHPGDLVTSGAFAISRNPIYTAFGGVLLGIFFIFPNWVILLYVALGFALFNRQVHIEEASLKKIYGEAYLDYCKKVRRYI